MEKQKNKYLPLILESSIVIIGILGQIFSIRKDAVFRHLLFYTNQSNMWIVIIMSVFVVYDILILTKKEVVIPNFLKLIKFIMTVAITITFLVFWLMLSPGMIQSGHISYLVSKENIIVHNLVPILAIIDFFVCDYDLKITKHSFLWGIIMPLYYLVFANVMVLLGVSFGAIAGDNSNKFPYFFLDYDANGFFSITDGKIGVVYWVIILIGAFTLLSYLFMLVKETIRKKKEKTDAIK